MVARVVLLIVIVAVLGFFGTRGSEKVVEEVTERQHIVDDTRRDVAALTTQVKELTDTVRTVGTQHERQREESARVIAELQARVLDLESRRQQSELRNAGPAAVEVVARGVTHVRVDGLDVTPPLLGDQALKLERGEHALELMLGTRRVTYQLFVVHGGLNGNVVVINGDRVRVSGDLVANRR